MKNIYVFILAIFSLPVMGQQTLTQKAQPIVAEGKLLYKSEMASWYGTDLFLEKFTDRSKIGGYFSYTENQYSKCIFFSKSETPIVIGTIVFDSTFATKNAKVDLQERAFTDQEKVIYTIRQMALKTINSDTLFKTYNHTSLNLIPLITATENKVYILTGPEENGVVIFGNDYLLTFNSSLQLIGKKALHRNIIPLQYGKEKMEGGIHTHQPETGDFITATDICTLMLYEHIAKWNSYQVVSENYLNIWNCETDTLIVISRKAADKIEQNRTK